MINIFPANNGERIRFRIGSVNSAQFFQRSSDNFSRLRYKVYPSGDTPTLAQLVPKVKPNRIKIFASKSEPNRAVVVPT